MLGVFCVGGALVIGYLGQRAAQREVITGTVLSFAMGHGGSGPSAPAGPSSLMIAATLVAGLEVVAATAVLYFRTRTSSGYARRHIPVASSAGGR